MKHLILIMAALLLAFNSQAKTKTTIGQNAKKIITLLIENGVQEDVYQQQAKGIVSWSFSNVSCTSRSNSALDPEAKYFLIPDVSCKNIALGRTASRRFMDILGELPFHFVDCALGGLCGVGNLDMRCQIDTNNASDLRFSCEIDQL